MSFRGIAEFVLHVDHFRNVDLLQQGLYYLRFQVYNEDLEKVSEKSSVSFLFTLSLSLSLTANKL